MSEQSIAEYAWLETLLELFFERFDEPAAREFLRDADARRQALGGLAPALLATGPKPSILPNPAGQHLPPACPSRGSRRGGSEDSLSCVLAALS